MEIFTRTCSQCGHSNSKQAKFCAKCGITIGGGSHQCGVCGTQNRSDALFCKECGREMKKSAAPEMIGNRWARREQDFATRIDAQDLPGLFRRGIQVEMGTNVLLLEDGINQGVLPPGSYTLDSIEKRLRDWLSSGHLQTVTALLVDIMPTELKFHMGGIFTSDPIGIGVSIRLQAQVHEPARFLVHMLNSRERLSLEDLREYLYPEVAQIVDAWVRKHTIQQLAEDQGLKEKLELALDEGLKATFSQTGIKFINIRTMDLNMEHLDHIKGIQSRYALQATEAEAEAAGKTRLMDVMADLNMQEIVEKTQKVEAEERRAELYNRMRKAVMSQKMDEVRSDADFDIFLDDLDRQKLLREKDRDELISTWKDEAEDHDIKRTYIADKLRVEQEFLVKKMAKEQGIELESLELDFEQERERKRIEIEELERKQDLDSAREGIRLMGELKETRRTDETERAREDQRLDLEKMEAEESLRQAERDHELVRLEKLAHLGTEALISASDTEQAHILADLKKSETLKDMTEEQILAAAAKDSPEVARAFGEKYRAIAEGNTTEREMYERLLGDQKEVLKQVSEAWQKSSAQALDRISDTAQAFARGQGGAPVVLTPNDSVRPRGGSGPENNEHSKSCVKCGQFVPVSSLFCEHCGQKFEGMN